ncbi:sensor histidine kinase [Nonomuraea phyllanthi]|uniref:Sensor histidine kinase n=1 Tax=Nonomuraea phyllanthi TaxID=2219224 RepID=A0A5C4WWP6_9ACTN|nr:histidine kinase [Nonomuraea phyllanthi]KAB8197245.1 sensor histidine kinase [Nonomuraea phyllanthi]QFY06758.1 sensor histidine kinase [Nonomuraea phyllanthi]
MDEIQRARRITWRVLVSGLVVMWLSIVTASVVAIGEGSFSWWRAVPAALLALGFTWLCPRVVNAILDRRYPTRQVAVAAVLALGAAGLGGAEPFGWGFVLMCWLSVATLEVSKRTAVLLAAGAWVAGVGLVMVWVNVAPLVGRDLGLVQSLASYTLLCVLLPPFNRVWVWVWNLAVQAHEGREAHTRLALAEERLRFARDLHDLVGHQLSAIAVKTGLAVRLSDVDQAAAKAEMAEVNTLTRQALKELRQAVRGYRELDLTAELNSVKGVLEAAGVRCEVGLPHGDLPDGVAPVFASALREAVTNVLKHSTATFCDITIRFTAREAELSVRNDGVAGQRPGDLGSGLTGVRERLAAVGGTVSAHPTEDGDFLLKAVVSLPIGG